MSGTVRMNASDPADAAKLMSSGLFWQGGPRTLQEGVDMLVAGDIAPTRLILQNIPKDILALVDRKRTDAGDRPLAEIVRLYENDGA